ncbi:hypothetical protein EYF80_034960 [Liparis tanakae]|uniref:Uncharacterized protein n=1 Tax=Liparis tanakae TaxID=230148 RepID=A0A4Z2GNI5_9TELE|nr:hypothetical protein EYF80_034960 [Liparis tanakae]
MKKKKEAAPENIKRHSRLHKDNLHKSPIKGPSWGPGGEEEEEEEEEETRRPEPPSSPLFFSGPGTFPTHCWGFTSGF